MGVFVAQWSNFQTSWRCKRAIMVKDCMLNHFSHVQVFATPWTVAGQAPLSLGFSRQEHRSGLSCPSPGDLPNPGIELSSMSPALSDGFFITSTTWEALVKDWIDYKKITTACINWPDLIRLTLTGWTSSSLIQLIYFSELMNGRNPKRLLRTVWHIAICPKFYYYDHLIIHLYFL